MTDIRWTNLHPAQAEDFVPKVRLLSDHPQLNHPRGVFSTELVTKDGAVVDKYVASATGIINEAGASVQWTLRERPSQTYLLVKDRSGSLYAFHNADREVVHSLGRTQSENAADALILKHFDQFNSKEIN